MQRKSKFPMAWLSPHGKLQSATVPGRGLLRSISFAGTPAESWPTAWPTRRKLGLKTQEWRIAEWEPILEENILKKPEHNESYTPERLVRMRSPVRIWPAAPKKPDSFENQAFLRLFYSEICSLFLLDPLADPREGKFAEKSPGERFNLVCSMGAF